MSTKHQLLWGRVKKILEPLGHIVRVENSVDPGMPDINYCINGIEGWLELKIATITLRNQLMSYRIEPAQPIWWRNRIRARGRIRVLVETSFGYLLLYTDEAIDLNGKPWTEAQHKSFSDLKELPARLRFTPSIVP